MTPAEQLAPYRSQVEAALAYAGGTHTFEDVAAGVERGELLCWFGPQSIIISEVVEYPRLRALRIFLAGGRMREIEAMTPHVLAWGKQQGCTRAEFTGRRGWTRTFLTRSGWTNSQLEVLGKEL